MSEEKVVCPFNPNHFIARRKLQYHLVKCGRNYSRVGLRVCTYNATHIIPEAKLQDHEEQCSDGEIFKRGVPPQPNNFPIPHIEVACDENWDNEPPTPTYNPEKYIEQHPILKRNDLLSPSEIKALKISERKRFAKF